MVSNSGDRPAEYVKRGEKIIHIKSMRKRQFAAINLMTTPVVTLSVVAVYIFNITSFYFYLTLAIFCLFQGGYGVMKRESTSSIIPIYEEVNQYEKSLMGEEWVKQKKVINYWLILFSMVLFGKSFVFYGSAALVLDVDPSIIIAIIVMIILMINIGQLFHIYYINRLIKNGKVKGFWWKQLVIASVIGLLVAFVMMFVMILYITSGI